LWHTIYLQICTSFVDEVSHGWPLVKVKADARSATERIDEGKTNGYAGNGLGSPREDSRNPLRDHAPSLDDGAGPLTVSARPDIGPQLENAVLH
jgi:hypothetical protein